MPVKLHSLSISAPYGSEQSASYHSRFSPMEVTAVTTKYEIEWIPEPVRHNEGEINHLSLLNIEKQFLRIATCSLFTILTELSQFSTISHAQKSVCWCTSYWFCMKCIRMWDLMHEKIPSVFQVIMCLYCTADSWYESVLCAGGTGQLGIKLLNAGLQGNYGIYYC
jgi:hypothetical protein